ncbi:hypothetical protein AWB67_05619 [Caballeronia terrestris]|uniref:Lipoprotein n=1 Tax=Caballeronia terrestris TaxID=1226301 RepID=A0A158KI15_9BURK|nr:hypothetical protein [Caballeronia terrestris]SAL80419.1 hypothetical protein AWB67_05619 [Caballeronia terrestris]
MRKLLVLCCLVPTLAFASDWAVVRKADHSWWLGKKPGQKESVMKESTVFTQVDRESIVTDGQFRQVWWKETGTSKDGYVLDLISLTTFDCKEHTWRDNRSGGRNSLNGSYEWEELDRKTYRIEPDGPWDHIYGAICLNKWK